MTGHISVYGVSIGLTFIAGVLIGLLIRHRAGGMAFWAAAFSDGGYPSFSRISSAFVIVTACGWVSHELWNTNDMTQVATFLREVTPFLASTLALTYGINKIGATIGAIKGPQTGQPAAQPGASTPPKP